MDVLTYGLLNKKVEEAKNVSGEKITEAVNTYLDENPVAAGATSEQVKQIQDNTNKITELKGDLIELNYNVFYGHIDVTNQKGYAINGTLGLVTSDGNITYSFPMEKDKIYIVDAKNNKVLRFGANNTLLSKLDFFETSNDKSKYIFKNTNGYKYGYVFGFDKSCPNSVFKVSCRKYYTIEEKINDISQVFIDVTDNINFVENTGILAINEHKDFGKNAPSSILKAGDYIELNGCTKIKITMPIYESETSYGLCFYSIDKSPIEGIVCNIGESYSYEERIIMVPQDAYYFRPVAFNDDSIGDFYCKLYLSINNCFDRLEKLTHENVGTVIVSANNSSQHDKMLSQFVCTGTNDEIILQEAIDSLEYGGTVILANGTYNIDGFVFNNYDYKTAFGERGENSRNIIIKGMNTPCRKYLDTQMTHTAIINVRQQALDMISGEEQRVSVLGYNGLSRVYPKYTMKIKNIAFMLDDNQHQIICVDMKYLSSCIIENIFCAVKASTATEGGVATYSLPNEKCIAIRGVDGGNMGTPYRISNCFVFGYGVAYDLNGEHLIAEQCGTRFCDYSYRFGYDTSKYNIHDLTLINCCQEYTRRYPLFTGHGGQGINFINYNVEENYDGDFALISKAVDDSEKGYYGDITFTSTENVNWENISRRFFENDNGKNFKVRNLAHKLCGSDSEIPIEPNEYETFYNTTNNTYKIYINGEWKKCF